MDFNRRRCSASEASLSEITNLQRKPKQSTKGQLRQVLTDVRFKQQKPYFEILAEVLKPTCLVPSLKTISCFSFTLHFTNGQRRQIVKSREFKSGVHSEYNVQVQLRFGLVDTGREQDDIFPPSLCIQVNGQKSEWINPGNKTKVGLPIDITAQCVLAKKQDETVDVLWSPETGQEYCVAVHLVRKLSNDTLLEQLKEYGIQDTDETVTLIKKKLAHDTGGDIAATSLKVSLLCPISKSRIQTPCRSSTCNHLQCFDASTYLMMNEKKPRWVCPLCDKPAPFDKLLIDGYFVKVFQEARSCSDIELHGDGSWVPILHYPDIHLISSPVTTSSPSSLHTDPSTKPLEVIDLTLVSSDDENVHSGTKSKKRRRQDMRSNQFNKKQRISLCTSKEIIPAGTHQSNRQSNHQYSHQSTHQSSHQSPSQSSNQSTSQFTCQSSNMSHRQSSSVSNSQSTSQFINMSHRQSSSVSNSQSTSQFRYQSPSQHSNMSKHASNNQSNSQFINTSDNQSRNMSNSQPSNQSISQPSNLFNSQSSSVFINLFNSQSSNQYDSQFLNNPNTLSIDLINSQTNNVFSNLFNSQACNQCNTQSGNVFNSQSSNLFNSQSSNQSSNLFNSQSDSLFNNQFTNLPNIQPCKQCNSQSGNDFNSQSSNQSNSQSSQSSQSSHPCNTPPSNLFGTHPISQSIAVYPTVNPPVCPIIGSVMSHSISQSESQSSCDSNKQFSSRSNSQSSKLSNRQSYKQSGNSSGGKAHCRGKKKKDNIAGTKQKNWNTEKDDDAGTKKRKKMHKADMTGTKNAKKDDGEPGIKKKEKNIQKGDTTGTKKKKKNAEKEDVAGTKTTKEKSVKNDTTGTKKKKVKTEEMILQ